MRPRSAALVVVVLLATTFILQAAQTGLGTLSGTVVDQSGGTLPGSTVEVKGASTGRAITDARGAFRIAGLSPGRYVVEVALAGFTTSRTEADVAAGANRALTISLQVGSLAETISVASARSGRQSLRQSRAVEIWPGDRRSHQFNTEAYDHTDENPFKRVVANPLSTFSIDVDTASYANVRRFLRHGRLPEPGAVRVEELINYFRLPYAAPTGIEPLAITAEVAACPWNPEHRLALVGIQGRSLAARVSEPRNLVFLVDVSGSMMSPDKLELVKSAMRLLVDALSERDRVAVVVYAGASGLALPSTSGRDKAAIAKAIAELEAGGATNGAAGIELAYRIARDNFITNGVNRVVLATDGDFNVGVTSQDALVRLIERERESGVFLSVLGVGTGNLKDSTMEKLADKGNGNYAYLDSLQEARKVLVHELGGTLMTIAKDVKIQVEFNPRAVDGYRLIGYENRILADEDFADDRKDAGEIGAGHSVTALYEIVPKGKRTPGAQRSQLKYQTESRPTAAAQSDDLLTVAVRFKAPDGKNSDRLSLVVSDRTAGMSPNLGFASAVAEFGMLLRGSAHAGQASYQSVLSRARQYRDSDDGGYRAEFIQLVEQAASLSRSSHASVGR